MCRCCQYLTTLPEEIVLQQMFRSRYKKLRTVVEVLIASLLAEDEESPDDSVEHNRHGTEPPNEGISDQVDVFMVLDPEVLNVHQLKCQT